MHTKNLILQNWSIKITYDCTIVLISVKASKEDLTSIYFDPIFSHTVPNNFVET
jgi:hypothetical protein